MAEHEVQVVVRIPEGLELTNEEIRKIVSEFENPVIERISGTRAEHSLIEVEKAKRQEVREKAKQVEKTVE